MQMEGASFRRVGGSPGTLAPDGEVMTRTRHAVRPVVLIPTYNNSRTLGDVVMRVRRLSLPIVVVDDGSTDVTAQVLAHLRAPDLWVLCHEANRGKAAALRTGFAAARDLGFTHAVTIDSDGQLDPEQIPDLLAVAQAHPRDLVVGVRDASAPDYPRRSALGRSLSNLLVRLECGSRVADSQCGYRVYPLASVLTLNCRVGRYGYETEVLTRAVWAGLEVRETPVRCRYFSGDGRVSHLKPARETLRALGMHGRLLWEARRRTVAPLGPKQERHWFALSLAVGVFVACLPVYGLQTIAGLTLAWLLGLNAAVVVGGSLLSTPPLNVVLIAAAVGLGHLLSTGHLPAASGLALPASGWATVLSRVGADWLLGSFVEGLVLGLVSYLLARCLRVRLKSLARLERSFLPPEKGRR